MKKIVCSFIAAGVILSLVACVSWGAQPNFRGFGKGRHFLGSREASGRMFGLGKRRSLSPQDKDRLQKMFQRFKVRKPLNKRAP